MSHRIISNPPAILALLAGLLVPLWTNVAHAQIPAPPAPAATATPATPAAYRSAFEGYQPYTDEKIVNWKEANDTVGRIGGWREYAKEASRPEPEPQAPAAATRPDPQTDRAKP